jgi:excinuclease ABC subunit C
VTNFYGTLPDEPGVYIFRDAVGKILYIGKAANLKRRVSSYFTRPHDYRIQKMVSEIRKVEHRDTDTALEALILEAKLIKKYKPPFNIREKDDKSFLFVEIMKEDFPRVLLVRGKEVSAGLRFGPFTSASSVREALRIIRRIFPFSVHSPESIGKSKRPCFDYGIGLCPGTCTGLVTKADYLKNIRNIKLFFGGKKAVVLRNLEKEMEQASAALEFEKAGKLKRRIFALRHIQDIAFINESEISGEGIKAKASRIEGYDISNISGTSAVGSMVVFRGNRPDIDQYRKFKIRTIEQSNDVGMLREVLRRRFSRRDWSLPDLVLIDGGKGQVNAAREVIEEAGFKIPVVGIAKGPERKKNEFVGKIPEGVDEDTLIKVRNEAHRFAISYYRKLGRAAMIN